MKKNHSTTLVYSMVGGLTAIAAGLTFSVQDAQAYVTRTCLDKKLKWSSNTVTMRAGSVSFANADWQNALSRSIARWNENPSNFRFSLQFGDTSVGRGNGQNEVWFSSDDGILDGAPAIALTWYDCIDYWIFGKDVEITEVDVVFDSRVNYTPFTGKTGIWNYNGSNRPFETTAIHELGHAVGLKHENDEYNTMGQDWTHVHVNGNSYRGYAGEDASSGAVYLYGTRAPAIEDLAVSQWKWSGRSGEYSTHTRTKMYTSTGGALSTFTVGGETGYKVNKGQKVRFELTYENNGANTHAVSAAYYVSTNSTITTFDTKIGNSSFTLGRNDVYTQYVTLTIPSNLTSGQTYYLGGIIDSGDAVSEIVESNNATYIPIKIN